jgi:hypothetical protein
MYGVRTHNFSGDRQLPYDHDHDGTSVWEFDCKTPGPLLVLGIEYVYFKRHQYVKVDVKVEVNYIIFHKYINR